MLGMSEDHFRRHVAPDVRAVYSGSLTLYPTEELQRWVRENMRRAPAERLVHQ